MTENFLHYLWQNRLFTQPLTTTHNETVTVINPGFHNTNAGPDFSDARLSIGETMWAGNVEIHVNSSDWFKHGHQDDEAYKNVVLHVVYRHDAHEKFPGMPVCELAGRIDTGLYDAYCQFIQSPEFVHCAGLIQQVPATELSLWLERMLIEKLEHKADFIQDALNASQNDWEEAFYHIIARSFGFSINALPFEMLARSVTYKILAHHAGNTHQMEALLFGQAGLLTQELTDPYAQSLFQEYTFLRTKYKLAPIAQSLWKYLRLRPVNFPTIRISQFANLLSSNAGLLSKIISMNSIDEMADAFMVESSEYWNDHYTFDHYTKGKTKRLGQSAAHLLIINAVLPFMFVYGSSTGNDHLCNKALSLFERIPGENNSAIRQWQALGMDVSTAYNTQALMGMKELYCDRNNCLNCRIGNLIFKDPAFIK